MTGRGELFERKHNLEQARADYRSASFALTPYDNYEVAAARQKARERLAALTPQAPAGATTTKRVALVIGNGAYKNVPQLANPPRDAKLIADSLRAVGFQDSDACQRPDPRRSFSTRCARLRATPRKPTGR